MKINKSILFIVFLAVSLFACETNENEQDDPATKVSGTYSGNYHYSGYPESFPANITLKRKNDSIVVLSAIVDGHNVYTLNVKVKVREDSKFDLSWGKFASQQGFMFGQVDGRSIEYIYNDEGFVGTKP